MLQKISCLSESPTRAFTLLNSAQRKRETFPRATKPYRERANWRGLVCFGLARSHVPLCKLIKSAPLTLQGLGNEEHMKNLSLLAVLLMAGCASSNTNQNAWYKNGMTDEQFRIDSANCKIYAHQSANPLEYLSAPAFILDSGRQNGLYNDCMESKGYMMIAETNKAVKLAK